MLQGSLVATSRPPEGEAREVVLPAKTINEVASRHLQ